MRCGTRCILRLAGFALSRGVEVHTATQPRRGFSLWVRGSLGLHRKYCGVTSHWPFKICQGILHSTVAFPVLTSGQELGNTLSIRSSELAPSSALRPPGAARAGEPLPRAGLRPRAQGRGGPLAQGVPGTAAGSEPCAAEAHAVGVHVWVPPSRRRGLALPSRRQRKSRHVFHDFERNTLQS